MSELVDLSGAVLQRGISSPTLDLKNYLTVEEDASDDAEITRHPVEFGAIMSDHIILMPPELKLRLGWSNADDQATGAGYVRGVYAKLLQLKNNRQLFTVYTGKRFYTNMFVASLRGPLTNSQYEWSMIVELMLRQVLLVDLASASSAPTAVNAASNPAADKLADPATSQQTVNTGPAQATTTNVAPDTVSGLTPQLSSDSSFAPAVTNSDGGGAGPSDYFQGSF